MNMLKSPHAENWSWQTGIGKLKLVFVNNTRTFGEHVGKQLCSPQVFHQRFRVGKLVLDVWMIGIHVLVTANQSKHVLYSRDLYARSFTKWGTQIHGRASQLSGREGLSSIAYKDTKIQTKESGGAGWKTEFRPNLSFPEHFLFLLFFCFPVVREYHCTK